MDAAGKSTKPIGHLPVAEMIEIWNSQKRTTPAPKPTTKRTPKGDTK